MRGLKRSVCKPQFDARLRGAEGAQIVELAVVLPLLMVLLVGIFDFGNAFNVKQKLTNAARAAARFGSSSPTNDLNSGGATPPSVLAIRNFVDDYLVAVGINDCGLLRAGTAQNQLSWTFTAAGNGCPGTLTLTIDRGCCPGLTAMIGGQPVQVISTHVQISYPYQWQFGSVFALVTPGATFATGVTPISTDAFVPNMD